MDGARISETISFSRSKVTPLPEQSKSESNRRLFDFSFRAEVPVHIANPIVRFLRSAIQSGRPAMSSPDRSAAEKNEVRSERATVPESSVRPAHRRPGQRRPLRSGPSSARTGSSPATLPTAPPAPQPGLHSGSDCIVARTARRPGPLRKPCDGAGPAAPRPRTMIPPRTPPRTMRPGEYKPNDAPIRCGPNNADLRAIRSGTYADDGRNSNSRLSRSRPRYPSKPDFRPANPAEARGEQHPAANEFLPQTTPGGSQLPAGSNTHQHPRAILQKKMRSIHRTPAFPANGPPTPQAIRRIPSERITPVGQFADRGDLRTRGVAPRRMSVARSLRRRGARRNP